MKTWNTPTLDQLSIADTAYGTEKHCQDSLNQGSWNGPGSTPEQQGVMCS